MTQQPEPFMINQEVLNAIMAEHVNVVESVAPSSEFFDGTHFYNTYIQPNLFIIIAILLLGLFLLYRYLDTKDKQSKSDHREYYKRRSKRR